MICRARTAFARAVLLPALCTALLTALFSLLAQPAQAHKLHDSMNSIEVNGRRRLYCLHVPPACANRQKLPLVIVFHGGMENGKVIRKLTGMNREADRSNFLVAYPYGTGRLKRKFLMWNAYDCCGYAVARNIDDLAFVSALIDDLGKRYEIDPNRVYACGFSNGAMFALRLACELSDKIAAVASVGGSMSGKEKEPSSPVSVLIIHGTADRHVPYGGGRGKWAKAGYPVNEKPVSYALSFFRKANSCTLPPQITDGADLRIESFQGGSGGSEVKLITLKGAGHTWPGGKQSALYTDRPFKAINATQECWKFFSEHERVRGDSEGKGKGI